MKKLALGLVTAVLLAGGSHAQQGADVHAVNARAHAEALKRAYYRLEDLIERRSAAAVLVTMPGGTPSELHGWPGDVPPGTVGGVASGWNASWTRRGVRARYCTDDPGVPGTLLVWLDPAEPMGVGRDHRSVVSAPRLYGRERRSLHFLESGVARGGDGRADVALPACMASGLPSGRAALAGPVEDPWVATSPRLAWERRDAACPAATHRPSGLPAGDPARTERRRVTTQVNGKGVEVGSPSYGPWEIAVDLCERDFTVSETETRSCSYTIEGQPAVGYKIVQRQKTVTAGGESFTPWVELFSTCWSGTVASIPPPSGTPETLPRPTITFPTWVETEPDSCPACYDGTASRWRRHTDRHVRFPWDSQPTVQTDVNVTNWVRDTSACTPTPPTVLGTETSQARRARRCAAGMTGSITEIRSETHRREVPCGGTERRVLVSAGAWVAKTDTCRAVEQTGTDNGGGDYGDSGGDDGEGDGEGEGGLGDGEDAAVGGDGLGSETADPSDDGLGAMEGAEDGGGGGGDGDGGGDD